MIDILQVLRTLKSHPRAGRLFFALCLKRAGLSRFCRIKHRDFVIRFHPTALATALFVDPDFRREDYDFLHAYLKPGDMVVDVGANIGTLSLTASLCVGRLGKILAFEPHPKTFDILVENIKFNNRDNISPVNVALGAMDGALSLSDSIADDQNAILLEGPGLNVPVRRLDSYLRADAEIALLKVDAEGYEKFILLGGRETLKRTRCVFFESWETHFVKYGYHSDDFFQIFQREGFQIYRTVDRTIQKLPSGYVSMECENLLALRDIEAFLQRTAFALSA